MRLFPSLISPNSRLMQCVPPKPSAVAWEERNLAVHSRPDLSQTGRDPALQACSSAHNPGHACTKLDECPLKAEKFMKKSSLARVWSQCEEFRENSIIENKGVICIVRGRCSKKKGAPK